MVSDELKNAESTEDVVRIINYGGTSFESPEEVAAKYAFLLAMKAERPSKEDIQAELKTLMEEGALFEYPLALEQAETYLINTLNEALSSQSCYPSS